MNIQENEVVLSEQNGLVRIITLNRPECLNAINPALLTALRIALMDANEDAHTAVIVLQGAGRAFCTGNDLKDSATSLESDYSVKQASAHANELQEITRQLVQSEKIVIYAVHGWAVGAGFEWVINCDFSVWADNARAFFSRSQFGPICNRWRNGIVVEDGWNRSRPGNVVAG